MIVSTGTIMNSTWGYYLTSSNITPTASNIPGWSNNSQRWDSWLAPTLAPNGHLYSAPGTATCVLKVKSGSINLASTNYSSTTVEFITASSAGGTLFLPGSTGTANVYEKFPSLVLAPNGKMYAVDYSFIPANNASSTTGYIIEVNPSNDTYITQSFQYPGGVAQRCVSNVLGIDGYIYWMINSPTNTNSGFRVYRFDPNISPFIVESSSLLNAAPLGASRVSYIGSLAPNGRIYFIPRAPLSTSHALCVSTSLFTPNTQNGITKITFPTINPSSTTADIAYWSRGIGLDNCVYYSPRYNNYGGITDFSVTKTLKLDPYGGTAGTGSFTLVGPQMALNSSQGNISQGYLRTLNGDLFSFPASSWNTSFSIVPSSSSPTVISSSFYPININGNSLRSPSPSPLFLNGVSTMNQPVVTSNDRFNIFFYEFFSVKGNYSGVTNFNIKDTDLYTPPTPISSISSSRYNWYSNYGV